MPTNLNALVRYKTIDSCLRNNSVSWTIEKLQQACTEATGEFKGIYKEISERTIRDDIRIMRSEILGFNAPIACIDGVYKYSDPKYSIFDVPIKTREIIEKTISFIENHINFIESEEKHSILNQLRETIADESDYMPMFQLKSAEDIEGPVKDNTDSETIEESFIDIDSSSEETIPEPDKPTPGKTERETVNWGHVCRLFFN